MEVNKNLSVSQQQNVAPPVNFFSSTDLFKEGWNMAGVLANSDLVPAQFKGKPANCLIALNMANRMGADFLQVMQSLVVVHGTPTFEAKFAIACFNKTGRYSAIKYKEEGKKGTDSWGFRAYAIEKSTGDIVEGPLITIGTAKLEGWYEKNPKWKNVPELMLRYRSASWFIRTTDPGVMMGFQTREEAEDYIDYVEVDDRNPITEEETIDTTTTANAEVIDIPKEKPAEAEKPKNTKQTVKQETPDIFK